MLYNIYFLKLNSILLLYSTILCDITQLYYVVFFKYCICVGDWWNVSLCWAEQAKNLPIFDLLMPSLNSSLDNFFLIFPVDIVLFAPKDGTVHMWLHLLGAWKKGDAYIFLMLLTLLFWWLHGHGHVTCGAFPSTSSF